MIKKEERKKSINKCTNESLLSSAKGNVKEAEKAMKGTEDISEAVGSDLKSGEIITQDVKDVISAKISTSSDASSTKTLTEILNDIQSVCVPSEIGSRNESTKPLKKVLQRAQVAKDTANIMSLYDKCGEESDAIVDKILADMTVATKTVNTERRLSEATEIDLAKAKKNVKSSSTSAIEPKAVGPVVQQKNKTIRLGDE